MEPLRPREHGYFDYGFAALLAAAPLLFDFDGTPAVLCYLFAFVHVGVALTTAYPFAIVRAMPFTFHGAYEGALAVGMISSPWLFGFRRIGHATAFFVAAGAVLVALVAVTAFRMGELREPEPDYRGLYGQRERHA